MQDVDVFPKFSLSRLGRAGLAALSLAGCSTTGERLSGVGVGAVSGGAVGGPAGAVVGGVVGGVTGPAVATSMGVPHRHHPHYHHYQ